VVFYTAGAVVFYTKEPFPIKRESIRQLLSMR
jgi:hypothetical protein